MAEKQNSEMILKMLGTLNESQSRWYVATEAISYGYGGVKEMHRLTGMSPTTIIKGIKEIRKDEKLGYEGRIRKPGGGRKSLEQKDKTLSASLHQIVDKDTAGDPMTWLKWTTKSEHRLADALNDQGHDISYRTVGRMLHSLGYTLQSNKKNIEGKSLPERDA